jgi:hypothetical protein
MINKLYINGGKPPKYRTYNKRIRRMVFNDDIIYEYIPCTGLNIIEETISIPLEGSVGDTYNIDYNISPNDCTEPVNWSIETNSYFSISNGVLTRLVGDINLDSASSAALVDEALTDIATIDDDDELNILVTATCESYSDTIKLSIINDRSCSSFKFNENQVSINTEVIDDTYYKLKYTVTPDDCEDEVTYELSDPNIIKVEQGVDEFWVTTLSMGTCVITGRCGNRMDTCVVNVTDDATSTNIPCTGIRCDAEVEVDNENVTPENGGGQLINVTVEPANTTDVVTYTIHNTKMVYVECIGGKWYVFSNGINQAGTTVITFKCGKCSADCYVTVT